MKALYLSVLGVLAFAPSSHSDGCSCAVTWGQALSSIECENPCAGGCAAMIINTYLGQGAICICITSNPQWTGCCTIALVPPDGSGVAVPVGQCGGTSPQGVSCPYPNKECAAFTSFVV